MLCVCVSACGGESVFRVSVGQKRLKYSKGRLMSDVYKCALFCDEVDFCPFLESIYNYFYSIR